MNLILLRKLSTGRIPGLLEAWSKGRPESSLLQAIWPLSKKGNVSYLIQAGICILADVYLAGLISWWAKFWIW